MTKSNATNRPCREKNMILDISMVVVGRYAVTIVEPRKILYEWKRVTD